MPLVVAVIIIFAVIYIVIDNGKKNHASAGQNEPSYRKTNGRFENLRFMDHYFGEGHSLEVAHSMAVKDTIAAGYEPCIPITVYQKNKRDNEERGSRKPDAYIYLLGEEQLSNYDNYFVYSRRRQYIDQLMKPDMSRYDEAFIENPYLKEEDWNDSSDWLDEILLRRKLPGATEEWIQKCIRDHKELRRSQHRSGYIQVPDEYVYGNWPTNKFAWETRYKQDSLEMRLMKVGDWCTYPGRGTCEVVAIEYNYDKTKANYRLKQVTTNTIFSVSSEDKGIYRLKH